MGIWITGDIHADPRRFSSQIFQEQKEMTKEDIVIILGDFGLVWNYMGENSYERYWLDWLEAKPFTTVFIDGNHENFNRLYEYPVSKWNGGNVHFIRPSVIHLMRGQVFNIEGKRFFAFGGAKSHDIRDGVLETGDPRIKKWEKDYDKLFRINKISWWKQELPSQEEMITGIENLKRVNNQVDYILTHSPCSSVLKKMDGEYRLYETDILTDYLQRIKDRVDYKCWLFGHMHVNERFSYEKSICLYEQITRIL